ncbi:XRE family transcriptional regulator [Kitasatospora xanthocidica]|uniref:XRE family transcriptional regulator n=1 Tax=Kitasatospora xanthocidica TaxID=83382 RepID=A0A373A1U3_9ACTN|nr:helix-turn-helix transcriptional regulator [Kitasatospora xanthocidica]RGD62118.1 XRE family transcriptional regulator [Kitasatospora xanthocidica]
MRETDEVARLLQELKSRSGLSYGALAKRLHLSTSALHRYCNGDVMPTEFAPLDHFSRVCEATPQERVELYRLWVVVRATRGNRPTAAPEPVAPAPPAAPVPPATAVPEAAPAPEPVPDRAPAVPSRRRTRRRGVLAAVTVIALLVAVGVVATGLRLRPDGETDPARAADAGPSTGSPAPSLSPQLSAAAVAAAAVAAAGASSPGATGGADPSTSAPISVAVHPSGWDAKCDQYVVNRPPSEVPRPPAVPEAAGWASQVGAVPGHSRSVKLTVQGTGWDTVLLTGLNVRVTRVAAPLAWNAYSMGEGCAGGVGARSYRIDLDAARPVPVVADGSGSLPVVVTQSEPAVIEVTAETTTHDVSWYLELEWTSGNRKGMLPVDLGHGTPFRTSAVKDRPLYAYPAGGQAWEQAPARR